MAVISDEAVLDAFPDVVVTHDTKELYRGWLEHELRLNRCGDCGTWHHPPRPLCPECWSTNVQATPVSGTGTIHLLIWLRQGPPADGVDYSRPHPVATVELDEQPGLRFTSTVLDASMDDLSIGDRVRLDWITRNNAPFPVFRKATAGGSGH